MLAENLEKPAEKRLFPGTGLSAMGERTLPRLLQRLPI
jgi:hypothetical protein